jgi:hypothetical protein
MKRKHTYHYLFSFISYQIRRNKLLLVFILFLFFFVLFLLFFKFILSFSKINDTKVVLEKNENVEFDNLLFLSKLKVEMLKEKWRAVLGPQNILFWVLGERPNYLESVPEIEKINFEVNFLKRKVIVKPQFRQTKGVICREDGKCYVFDNYGIIFKEAPNSSGFLVLKIIDKSGRYLYLGHKILKKEEWFLNFKNVVEELIRKDIFIKEIIWSNFDEQIWEVKLGEGVVFIFSFKFTPPEFAYILDNLRKKLNFKDLNYIDFSVPHRIYFN